MQPPQIQAKAGLLRKTSKSSWSKMGAVTLYFGDFPPLSRWVAALMFGRIFRHSVSLCRIVDFIISPARRAFFGPLGYVNAGRPNTR
jgi:hypothetical protein